MRTFTGVKDVKLESNEVIAVLRITVTPRTNFCFMGGNFLSVLTDYTF